MTAFFMVVFVALTFFVAPWAHQRVLAARRRRAELARVGGRVVVDRRTQAPRFDGRRDPSPKPRRRVA